MLKKIRITTNKHGRGMVTADGIDLSSSVVAVRLDIGVGRANTVELTLVAKNIEFDGIADVSTVADETRKFEQLPNLQSEDWRVP